MPFCDRDHPLTPPTATTKPWVLGDISAPFGRGGFRHSSLISCNEIYSATALGSASPGKKLVPKKIVHFRNLHNLGGPSGGPYMKISGFCSKFTFLRNLQFPPGVMLKKGGLPFSSTTHARGRANIFPLTDQSHHHYPPTKLRRRARSGEQSDNHLLIFFV